MDTTNKVSFNIRGSSYSKTNLVLFLLVFHYSTTFVLCMDNKTVGNSTARNDFNDITTVYTTAPSMDSKLNFPAKNVSEKMIPRTTEVLPTQSDDESVTEEGNGAPETVVTLPPSTAGTTTTSMKTTITSTSPSVSTESQSTNASTTSMKMTTQTALLISSTQSTTSVATPPPPPTPPTPPIVPTSSPPTPPTPTVFPTTTSSTTTTTTTTTTVSTSQSPSTTTTATTTITTAQRFCNKTKSRTYFTKCKKDCSEKDTCFDEDFQAQDSVDTCTYRILNQEYTGCHLRCLHVYRVAACCPGFWGDDCDQCPGGYTNPCNGYGECSAINGTCACQKGFTGTTCELCEDKNKYGPNCSQDCSCVNGQCNSGIAGDGSCLCESGYKGLNCDIEIPGCKDLDCYVKNYENWQCAEVNGNATCVCAAGFEFDDDSTDCEEIDPCKGPIFPCGDHSKCEHTGPGKHRCVCIDDYEGDGVVCTPIDPCQTNEGGCEDTSTCRYVAPNQHRCICKLGYDAYFPGIGCSLIDVCKTSTCDPNAVCETIEPFKTSCSCNEGYIGNGTVCYGNILQRIQEINRSHPKLRGDLQTAILIISQHYKEEMTQHGPFTVFVPNDRAFRDEIRVKSGLNKFLRDEDRILQIFRQHILIGQFELKDLQVYDQFYTLQGNPAFLQIRVRKAFKSVDVFKYKLIGASTKAKVVGRDFIASNGMIQVVNDLLTMKPEIAGDIEKTAMNLIKKEPKYNRLQSLINAAGLADMFKQKNYTVFAPKNSAWNNLPTGTLDYLMENQEGKEKLRIILKNHVFPGIIGITSLINMPFIKSLANVQVKVTISRLGQIQLDGKANVSQANIPCNSGYYHHIDGVLVPNYMDQILPSRCPTVIQKKVKGACSDCHGDIPCYQDTDKPTIEVKRCTLRSLSWSRGPRGCSRICLRDIEVPKCCPGFYSVDCIPCPGGFKNPCRGKGKCLDGFSGSGLCLCDRDFMGTACEQCRQKDVFGPNCNLTCTCLHGQCDEGPKGKGTCKWCEEGFEGENCDKKNMKSLECGNSNLVCHAHSTCYVNDDDIASCRCDIGYEGDGLDCVEIDPCQKEDNGGCHPQATCTKLGPGVKRCQCNPGWLGDGFECQPKRRCLDNTDCHAHADCYNSGPGQYHCVCNNGYIGNGKECVLANLCLDNNGGCHPKAICTSLTNGERNCTCPKKMAGDGIKCYGTIAEEVMSHPNLTILARIIQTVNPSNNVLDSEEETLTFFAPSDAAMEKFMTSFAKWNKSSYWTEEEHVIWFLNFHTLYTDYTAYDLLLLSGVYKKYPTLQDGFSLHIVRVDLRPSESVSSKSLRIYANHSDFASFVQADIGAVNGYIHIIDKVLEPFFPDDDDPTLENVLASRKEMSLFYEALQKANLLDELDDLDEYTVFVPNNEAMRTLKKSLTREFLKYYIVPRLVFTPSVLTNDTARTLRGDKHKLLFTVSDNRVQVNHVNIVGPDILIDGGVVQEIDGILHPVLKLCGNTSKSVKGGQCGDCDHLQNLACPTGYSWINPLHDVSCLFSKRESEPTVRGCQKLCILNITKSYCCSGYYGPSCEKECPGGAENPCSGHGKCSEGMTGTGQCLCDKGFSGTDCSTCVGYDVDCIGFNNSCEYRNGNCSEHAVCTQTTTGVNCRCQLGYVGDGYTCSSLCDTLSNRGCHAQAVCVFDPSTHAVKCTCKSGYHGNGTWCQENFDPCDKNNDGCDVDRARCVFTPPLVTDLVQEKPYCKCLEGFIGNGTLCVTDMVDAISRIPVLDYFYNWLQDMMKADSSNTSFILNDRRTESTLFVPVSHDWRELNISDIIIVGRTLRLSPGKLDYEDKYDTGGLGQVGLDDLQLVSLSGEKIFIIYNETRQTYYVNGVPIVDMNIEAVNGIIHLTSVPVVNYVKVQASTGAEDSSDNTVVIACVVILIVVIAAVVIGFILYKRSHGGVLQMFQRFQSESESNLSFARLSAQEEDDDSFKGSDSAKYDNPIFNDPDLM